MITDYTMAREAARAYLAGSKKQTICLLGGHVATEVIACCGICDVSGCISCLDVHDCEDYNKENWIA